MKGRAQRTVMSLKVSEERLLAAAACEACRTWTEEALAVLSVAAARFDAIRRPIGMYGVW
jgi:hypothetical protein